MDENGAGAASRDEVLEELRSAEKLIVVTHDRELGARAHRHIAMRDGEIVADEK